MKKNGNLILTGRGYAEYVASAPAEARVPDALEAATRLHVRRVFEKCDRNLTRAAEALGVSRNTARKYL